MSNIREIRKLTLEERIRLYNEAINFRKKYGWGRVLIARKIGVLPGTVEGWINKGVKPTTKYNMFRCKVSRELSYVIGVIFGDGSVTKSGYISLKAMDRDFVEKFALCLTKILNKNCPVRKSKGVYYVWIGCKLFCNFIRNGFEYLKPFIESYPKDFIQGFADSEGSPNVTIYRDRSKKRFDARVVVATNTNRALLEYIQNLLRRFFDIKSNISLNVKAGKVRILKGRIVKTTKNAYRLTIDRFSDSKKFLRIIGFSIARKQEKLKDSLEIKQKYGSGTEAINAWLRLYKKVNGEWIKVEI
jgi:intein-encoded DNA endonuclease-like protein